METNEIENLVYLKLHLESEIRLLENKSIYKLAENNSYNSFFSRYINNFKEIEKYCKEKKELLDNIDNHLYKHCPHKWYKDYIDINPDKSIMIETCKICLLTKN